MVIESISSSNAAYSTEAGKQSMRQAEKVEMPKTEGTAVRPETVETKAAVGVTNDSEDGQQQAGAQGQGGQQQMSQKFVSDAVSNANSHLPNRTKCEFYYDDVTNRVSITIKDKDTDEVIKEIPPKETLEMVAKMWELAGILVDEKR